MNKSLQHLKSWSGCYCMFLLILVVVILLGMRNTNNNDYYQTVNNNGRYQIASNSSNACWVIDTETSQLWMRNTRGGYDLGTNSNPHNARDRELKCTENSVWDEALKLK